jgi:hypothetical protein
VPSPWRRDQAHNLSCPPKPWWMRKSDGYIPKADGRTTKADVITSS